MTSIDYLTNQQKVRLICSNHMLYDTLEKLKLIMNSYNITAHDFDIANESWWESVGWWKNEAFVQGLTEMEINVDKEIEIKVNRVDTQKYFVSSKK